MSLLLTIFLYTGWVEADAIITDSQDKQIYPYKRGEK